MDRLLVSTALEGTDHQFLFAPNGEVALKSYQNNDIDLVITDLAMPNMNGILLIEEILAEDRNALIIAISGVSADQLERAEAVGVTRTIQKPYEVTELLEAVTQTLNRVKQSPSVGDLWQ